MEFKDNQAIYLQIADYIGEKILRALIKPGERVPSVRELAVELAVNPNTVARTFEHLTDEGVIKNQRGVGYFATEDAVERVKKIMRDEFFEKNLPALRRQMELLDLKLEDLRPFLLAEKSPA